jgi:hypothetical protein
MRYRRKRIMYRLRRYSVDRPRRDRPTCVDMALIVRVEVVRYVDVRRYSAYDEEEEKRVVATLDSHVDRTLNERRSVDGMFPFFVEATLKQHESVC